MIDGLKRRASAAIPAAVVAGFMVMAGSAHATTLSWGSGPNYVPGLGDSTAVDISSDTPDYDYNGYGVAFNVSDDGGVTNFLAWCLDINHAISLPSSYSLTTTPYTNENGSGVLNTTQKNSLGLLFNTAYQTLDTGNGAQVAGFQLALWEIAFEDDGYPYNILAGDFRSNWGTTNEVGENNAAVDFAANLLSNLNGTQTETYELSFWQAADGTTTTGQSQNLISAVIDPNGSILPSVPLPAAGWMLGLGILGLYGVKRRKKA